MKYIVANWKQNLSDSEAENWIQKFQSRFTKTEDKTIIVGGGFTHLTRLHASGLLTSAQDVSAFTQGAHTGRVGAMQLQGLVNYCIVGHSEVRKDLGDSDKTVALKISNLIKVGITPILCIDLPYLDSQIQVLKQELLEVPKMLVAYEPVAAIGSGHPANPRVANEVSFKVKSMLGNSTPVLYGGSVTQDNVGEFTGLDHIDGVLVGSDSLDPTKFIELVDHA